MRRFRLVCILLFILTGMAAHGEKNWELNTGIKGSFSTGASETFFFYEPFIDSGYKTEYFSVSAGYSRDMNYQVADSNGIYDYLNIHRVNVGTGLTFIKDLTLNLAFDYSVGDSEYEQKDYGFGIEYEFADFSILGEYSFGDTEYVMNSVDININNYDFSFEAAFYYSKMMGFDLSFVYLNAISDSLDYDYDKYIFRAGVLAEINSRIYLSGGLSLGIDSSDYLSPGADVSFSVLLWDHVKIAATYIYSYNLSPDGSVSKQMTGATTASINESYNSHSVIMELSFSF